MWPLGAEGRAKSRHRREGDGTQGDKASCRRRRPVGWVAAPILISPLWVVHAVALFPPKHRSVDISSMYLAEMYTCVMSRRLPLPKHADTLAFFNISL